MFLGIGILLDQTSARRSYPESWLTSGAPTRAVRTLKRESPDWFMHFPSGDGDLEKHRPRNQARTPRSRARRTVKKVPVSTHVVSAEMSKHVPEETEVRRYCEGWKPHCRNA